MPVCIVNRSGMCNEYNIDEVKDVIISDKINELNLQDITNQFILYRQRDVVASDEE